ncbi:MAG: hypothetical protein FRX49_02403 [Trebouxia sp. A1-2]|nr:MAG: hypothetical protein FRX49_02403 [Trebouxia sp. A1-2]
MMSKWMNVKSTAPLMTQTTDNIQRNDMSSASRALASASAFKRAASTAAQAAAALAADSSRAASAALRAASAARPVVVAHPSRPSRGLRGPAQVAVQTHQLGWLECSRQEAAQHQLQTHIFTLSKPASVAAIQKLADGRRTVHPSILALPPLQAWVPQPHSLGTHPAQLELCQRQCGGPALTIALMWLCQAPWLLRERRAAPGWHIAMAVLPALDNGRDGTSPNATSANVALVATAAVVTPKLDSCCAACMSSGPNRSKS